MNRLMIAFSFLISFQSTVFAAFEINKIGPWATAANDVYSALGNEPWAMIYNPAQVVRLEGAQAALAYSRPYLNFGNFKANIAGGIFTREAMGTAYGVGIIFLDTNVYYREVTGLFNVAHRFGEKENDWDFSVGTNLKILSLRRGDPTKTFDPALVPQTINRFTMDIGSLARFHQYYLGVSAQNVIPANIGVVVKDIVPVETRIGVGALNLFEIPHVGFKVSPAFEVVNRNMDTTASGAVDLELLDFADFMFGVGTRNVSFGFSVYVNQLRSGREKKFVKTELRDETTYRVDIGYTYPISGLETAGTPLLGMSILF